MTYTRSTDFVTAGSDRRSAKMNRELDLIAAESVSIDADFAAVDAALALKAPLASPALTGTPTAPTAALGTNTTQVATMAAVRQEIAEASAIGLPSQATHGPASPLITNGTTLDWDDDAKMTYLLPLVGTNTGYLSMPTVDQINSTAVSTGLGTTGIEVVYGSSLFIAFGRGSASNVASSPDGVTWTLRAMSGAATWDVASDGTNFLAAASGATTINKSTNGTSWSSATALAGNCQANPNVIGTTWAVPGTSVCNVSTNHGTSWSAETAPWTTLSHLLKVGGLFFACINNSTTYYTSATGLTGSWTTRTIPASTPFIWQNPDGTVSCATQNVTGSQVYKTTDGINWTSVSGLRTLGTSGIAHINLNDTWCAFSTTFGETATYNGGTTTIRYSGHTVQAATAGVSALAATTGSGLYVVGTSGTDYAMPFSTTGNPQVLHRIT